jgi:CDP-diacylglycerol---serine O-phosphatidyltransferase
VLTNPLVPGNEKRVAGGDFVGLPSPAAAGMIASLVLILSKIMEAEGPLDVAVQAWSWTLLPLMLIISFLMVSNVRFLSFKKLDWTARARTRGFILIIIIGAVVFRYPHYSFPAIFLGYISFSIFRHVFLLKKSEMDPAPDDDDEPVSKV